MPRASPFAIVLSKGPSEDRIVRGGRSFQRDCRCSPGHAAPDCQQVAQAIRRRATSWPGLATSRRASRPLSPSIVVQVKALACELPHRLQLPLSRLFLSEIRREVTSQLAVPVGDLVALAQRRCAPPLAASQLDLPTRPRFRRPRLGVFSIRMIAFGRGAL
jgi:hypothetical protein